MTDKTFVIQILQLVMGGGILIMMGKMLIAIGNYTARLESLEKSFNKYTEKVDSVYRDIAEIKGYMAAKSNSGIGG